PAPAASPPLRYTRLLLRSLPSSLSCPPPPPRPTLFPYTTLFRSDASSATLRHPCRTRWTRARRVGPRSCCRSDSPGSGPACSTRSEEHTSELQSRSDLVCRLLLEKKKKTAETSPRDVQSRSIKTM